MIVKQYEMLQNILTKNVLPRQIKVKINVTRIAKNKNMT